MHVVLGVQLLERMVAAGNGYPKHFAVQEAVWQGTESQHFDWPCLGLDVAKPQSPLLGAWRGSRWCATGMGRMGRSAKVCSAEGSRPNGSSPQASLGQSLLRSTEHA